MGNSASTPQTKVFTPNAPVEFSASFLLKLEQSQESEYSRAQHAEKYIQERVASELKRLEIDANTQYQQTAQSAVALDPTDSPHSSGVASEKLRQLTAMLQENIQSTRVELTDDASAARDRVIACLKENSGKTLNCWEEVESFRKLTASL